MKRSYINPNKFVLALTGKAPLTTPVGYAYDEHNRPMVAFIATDKDTGAIIKTKKGDVAFNWKPQKAKAQDAGVASLGEVLAPEALEAAAGLSTGGGDDGDVDASEDAPY